MTKLPWVANLFRELETATHGAPSWLRHKLLEELEQIRADGQETLQIWGEASVHAVLHELAAGEDPETAIALQMNGESPHGDPAEEEERLRAIADQGSRRAQLLERLLAIPLRVLAWRLSRGKSA